ncbi:MAG: hypothetical protein JSU04_18130 [Bdellovibrionales bacterium]|nr:hypothetical protein [Bdellovibrionales bacterium]
MKFFLPFVVFFGVVPAFATQKKCDVVLTTLSGETRSTEILTPRVIEGADIASYVMDKNFGDFKVFVSEVDGNYYAGIHAGANYSTAEGVESVTLTSSYRKRGISLNCY